MSVEMCARYDPTVLADADLASVGRTLGDEHRAAFLLALLGGEELPAGELASRTGASSSLASAHLAKLLDAGFIRARRQGRHRLYRISSVEVAEAIEGLLAITPAKPVKSLRSSKQAGALREARTCYDHVAGRLGVALMTALLSRGYITGGDGAFDADAAVEDRLSAPGQDVEYRLTAAGVRFVADFGVQLPPRRRAVGYCVDWTEQRHHVAGALGRGLRDRFLELDWVRRGEVNRALQVTSRGRRGFAAEFAIEV
jgi:DNA-binding transcriptional ArsR family regulator